MQTEIPKNCSQNHPHIFEAEFAQARDVLHKAQRIVIISHRSPDGDTIGANLALRLALAHQWGKEVISACADPPPPSCDFLPEVALFQNTFEQTWADTILAVDCGASYMMKFPCTPPVVNIDHHATNDNFGQINVVDPSAASTTQILYHFLKFCGFKITSSVATCLLNGLYYDTGSFMHSNTTPGVLKIASNLLWKGADFKTIARKQFHTTSVRQLKIYGKALERTRVNSKACVVSALTENDFTSTDATPDDATGIIDYLNSIPDGKFCCLLYEDKKGMLKGSFRTRADDIDLSELAKMFGGGGHKKAAGFSFPARLSESGRKIKIDCV